MKQESQALDLAHPATVVMSVLSGFVNKSRAFPFHRGSERMVRVCAPLLSYIAQIVRGEYSRTSNEHAEALSDLHALCMNYVATVWQFEDSYQPCAIDAEGLSLALSLADDSSEEVATMLCRHVMDMHEGCIESTLQSITMGVAFFVSKHVSPSRHSEYIFALVATREA